MLSFLIFLSSFSVVGVVSLAFSLLFRLPFDPRSCFMYGSMFALLGGALRLNEKNKFAALICGISFALIFSQVKDINWYFGLVAFVVLLLLCLLTYRSIKMESAIE